MKVQRFILFGFLTIFFSSCATILHQQTVEVHVYTDVDSAKVCIAERCYDLPATIELERSKRDVELVLRKDSVEKTIVLNHRLSNAFMFGNMGVWPGYVVDLKNSKRFTYPRENYVSLGGEKFQPKIRRKQKWIPTTKHQLNLKFSFPDGNYFYFNNGKYYESTLGFLGVSAGLEYYLSEKYSINSDFGVMTDFFLPFPAPFDANGAFDQTIAAYVDLQMGKDVGAFHWDFGIQGNKTIFIEREVIRLAPDYSARETYSFEQYNAGLALSSYYNIVSGFNLGLNYYPSFFAWNDKVFDLHYTHLLMLELVFKTKVID